MSDTSFLVTYYAQPDLLGICLDSIRKFHPDDQIIVSSQYDDDLSLIEDVCARYRVDKRITHDMKSDPWVQAAIGLGNVCDTDIGVYIEHDAFLMRNLGDMLDKIRGGEYDAIGVEEVIPSPGLNRNSPGFLNQNFFIINMKKIKEIGIENMRLNHSRLPYPAQNKESGHGISQVMENKLFLPVIDSGYGHGTFYGDIAHHLWYGSYKKRNIEGDGVNRMWMEYEANRLIKDYWDGKIQL